MAVAHSIRHLRHHPAGVADGGRGVIVSDTPLRRNIVSPTGAEYVGLTRVWRLYFFLSDYIRQTTAPGHRNLRFVITSWRVKDRSLAVKTVTGRAQTSSTIDGQSFINPARPEGKPRDCPYVIRPLSIVDTPTTHSQSSIPRWSPRPAEKGQPPATNLHARARLQHENCTPRYRAMRIDEWRNTMRRLGSIDWLHTLDSYTNAEFGMPRSAALTRGNCLACDKQSALDELGFCSRCAAKRVADHSEILLFRPMRRNHSSTSM